VHQYCLRILRRELDRTGATGATYLIRGGQLMRTYADGWSGGGMPDFLADPPVRNDSAAERACDQIAAKLLELVYGIPLYHPLFRDADDRLARMRAFLDRYMGKFRPLSAAEKEALRVFASHTVYVPTIGPLGRAATEEDVTAGRAVFHTDGKGAPAAIPLPATAVLARDAAAERPPRVLVVQAEVLPGGRLRYGVVSRHELLDLGEDDLVDLKPAPNAAKDGE
jgi:hypothetical protein